MNNDAIESLKFFSELVGATMQHDPQMMARAQAQSAPRADHTRRVASDD